MAIPVVQREQIARNLKTLLQGITTANGYFVGVKKVARSVENFDNARPDYPYIGIGEGLGEEFQEIPSDTSFRTMDVQLVSYIDKDSSGDAANATNDGHEVLNAWIEAILHRLNSDRTLGGYAIDVRPVRFQTNQGQAFDDGVSIRAVDLTIRIEYEDVRSSRTEYDLRVMERWRYVGAASCNWRDERTLVTDDEIEVQHEDLWLRALLAGRDDFEAISGPERGRGRED